MIQALNKNIIVKRDELSDKTTSGLITSHKQGSKSLMCTVKYTDDERIKIGDRLLLPNGVGYNFELNEELTSIKFDDIIGTLSTPK